MENTSIALQILANSCYKPMKTTFLTSQDDCSAPLVSLPACDLCWEPVRYWQRWQSRVCLDGLEMRREGEACRSKSLLHHKYTIQLWSISFTFDLPIPFQLVSSSPDFMVSAKILLRHTLPKSFLFENDYVETKIETLQNPYFNWFHCLCKSVKGMFEFWWD